MWYNQSCHYKYLSIILEFFHNFFRLRGFPLMPVMGLLYVMAGSCYDILYNFETAARVTLFHEESAKGCQPRIKKEKDYEKFSF